MLPDVAIDARWAVQACVARGYEVAIASAGCKAAFVKTFLQQRVDPDIFDDAFFTTPAFQTCVLDKTISMTRIVQYYGIDDARQCAILFDDIEYNTRYATSIGAGAIYVDNGALEFKARCHMLRHRDATPTNLAKICSPDFRHCNAARRARHHGGASEPGGGAVGEELPDGLGAAAVRAGGPRRRPRASATAGSGAALQSGRRERVQVPAATAHAPQALVDAAVNGSSARRTRSRAVARLAGAAI